MTNKSRAKSNSKVKNGSIRVIAGKYRGRKLAVLDVDGLRPTTDRVKETVFNWLMPYINKANCLDCFAGSGGLGFEALSRGAQHVTFLELNKKAAQQLTRNLKTLKDDNAIVINTDSLRYLDVANQQFDVVFIDPPFHQGLLSDTINKLAQNWLQPSALIYIEAETEAKLTNIPLNWQLLKEKMAGQVAYRLYQTN
ncbi:MAG: 16S rRNA (guanine(966)-N(2))-methyltransferase RsmD [Alteromonadaceae bacterium]|nr:16S rRNA (guanine(966)-N(2))-methyltransferase RsmD [Alteromonadaceae bacterium]